MVNRHIKNKKPATSAYKNDKNMYKNCSNSRFVGNSGGFEHYFNLITGKWNSDNL